MEHGALLKYEMWFDNLPYKWLLLSEYVLTDCENEFSGTALNSNWNCLNCFAKLGTFQSESVFQNFKSGKNEMLTSEEWNMSYPLHQIKYFCVQWKNCTTNNKRS